MPNKEIFVAFAFAGNDLLIQTDRDGAILYHAGSARRLLGGEVAEVGDTFPDLVAPGDQELLFEVFRRLTLFKRIDRVALRLGGVGGQIAHARLAGVAPVELGGSFFFSLARMPAPIPAALRARGVQRLPEVLEADDFLAVSDTALAEAEEMGEAAALTLVSIAFDGAAPSLQAEAAIVASLKAWSLDGTTVGRLGAGEYGVLHVAAVQPEDWGDTAVAAAARAGQQNGRAESRTEPVSRRDLVEAGGGPQGVGPQGLGRAFGALIGRLRGRPPGDAAAAHPRRETRKAVGWLE